MFKKFIIVVMLFAICGCGSPSSNKYNRSTKEGRIETITLADMKKKMDQNETFTVMLTQTMCHYCLAFENVLENYLPNHHLVLYNVTLDNEETSPQENLEMIHEYFPEFRNTPGVYHVEEGKLKSTLQPVKGDISEETLDTWVQELQLDKK